jgi:hypothetical protein
MFANVFLILNTWRDILGIIVYYILRIMIL